jgi:fatty-acyl-CoA synthase
LNTALPPTVRTLGDIFNHAAERYPGKEVASFLARDSVISSKDAIAFDQLARSGRVVARDLIAAGVRPGMPVAVLIQSALEFLKIVSGITVTGAVIVPLAVPIGHDKTHLTRLGQIIKDSDAPLAVVDDQLSDHLAEALPHLRSLTRSSLLVGEHDALTDVDASTAGLPAVHEEDLALIQYTSGSTSNPRGVGLTHRNLLAGIRALHHGVDLRRDDVLCHWLPLSNNMGLLSTLASVGAGIDIHISSPQDFLKYPENWLRKCSQFRASILGGPNFSYRYLLDAVPRAEAGDYDLSAIRVMLNGSEPIDPEIASKFAHHFAASGLALHVMTPCYGLAEAALVVTFAPVDEPVAVDWVDRGALSSVNRACPVAPGTAGARGIVCCGAPLPGLELRIVADGRELPARAVGEIEVRGEPVMRGYYRTSERFVSLDGWFSTGDLGYVANSCLYVTGRRKEMMIIGGRNYYPQDIEDTIRQLRDVHHGHAIAVALPAEPSTGLPERIAVLAEASVSSPSYGRIVSAIRAVAARELGGAAVDVVLVAPNSLLRTSSGKFQRLLMRQQLMQGVLSHVLIQVGADEVVSADDATSATSDHT